MKILNCTKTSNFYVVTVSNFHNDGIVNFSSYTLLSALVNSYDYLISKMD